MIKKDEIMEYLNSAPAKALRQYAMMATRVMTERQIKILDKYFARRLDFELTEEEVEAQDLVVTPEEKPEPTEDEKEFEVPEEEEAK